MSANTTSSPFGRRLRAMMGALAAAATLVALAGCASPASGSGAPSASSEGPAAELRLGYFANVTHAPALVGVQQGLLAQHLGSTTLTTQTFNAGPAAIEALSAGAIDATFIGPNPAINSFIQSRGASVRIVSGAASGGAALVVSDRIQSAADLKGANLATPQLGNTQDVALRSWLSEQGLTTSISGGNVDVTITPTENSQVLTLFQNGTIDGAWVPEPWVSRLVVDGKDRGAHVLVDEASLWPDGAFPTTVLLVNADFLSKHPETVKALIEGEEASIAWLDAHKGTEAETAINAQLQADTGKSLSPDVLTRALQNLTFTTDPNAAAFPTLVAHGVTAGTSKDGDIHGLFDLALLNETRTAAGQPTVDDAGLGPKGAGK